MDDTDMGSRTQPEPESGPAHDVAAATAPQVPAQRDLEVREHFDTPSWIGPARPWQQPEPTSRTEAVAASSAAAQAVPRQAGPTHEAVAPLFPQDHANPVLSEGRWVEHAPPRLIAGVFLVLSILGLIGALAASVITQSPVAIGATVACAVVVVVFRITLISSGVRTVELKNGRLTVSQDGVKELFNLTDPAHLVELIGEPGDPQWRLRLETLEGRIVELTPTHVDPAELHPAVVHYRAIASRELIERQRRFSR